MRHFLRQQLASLALCTAWAGSAWAGAAEIRVLHWWNAPSERAGITQLQARSTANGLRWVDAYSQADAMQRYPALIAEAMQNKQRPDAALVPTYLVAPLQQSGALVSLDALAQREGWDEVLPPAVSQQLKVNGQWFAAPLSVHSLNWLWVNASVAEQLGVVRPPDTWSEFIALLERARKAGITGIAIGPEAWEQALIFELIASGYLGPQRFRKLFLEGDVASFSARDLAPIFLRLRQIQPYLGAATASSFGVATTLQVARGEALLQLGGNWVEGFWQHLPQPPSAAFQCWRFPETQGVVHFNTDAFVFFSSAARSSTPPHTQQRRFAALLMQSDTQSAVQQASAAPPARLDVQHTALSPCGQRSLSDMRMASTRNTLLPNFFMGTAKHLGLQLMLPQLIEQGLQGGKPAIDSATHLLHMLGAAHGRT